MSSEWLRIENLSFEYPQTGRVLHRVSISATQDEPIVAVIGSSGIGKTTLLGLIGGWLKPTEGTISLSNKRVTGPCRSRAVVFQDHNLLPWKTVEENIAFALRPVGCAGDSMAIHDALSRLGLADNAHMYPAQLSGGMKQRVGLARALIVNPDVLLLDEPFSALDYFHREIVLEELEALANERDTKIVLVTHDLHVAARLARKIVVLDGDGSHVIPVSGKRGRRVEDFRFSDEFRIVLTQVESHFRNQKIK